MNCKKVENPEFWPQSRQGTRIHSPKPSPMNYEQTLEHMGGGSGEQKYCCSAEVCGMDDADANGEERRKCKVQSNARHLPRSVSYKCTAN